MPYIWRYRLVSVSRGSKVAMNTVSCHDDMTSSSPDPQPTWQGPDTSHWSQRLIGRWLWSLSPSPLAWHCCPLLETSDHSWTPERRRVRELGGLTQGHALNNNAIYKSCIDTNIQCNKTCRITLITNAITSMLTSWLTTTHKSYMYTCYAQTEALD